MRAGRSRSVWETSAHGMVCLGSMKAGAAGLPAVMGMELYCFSVATTDFARVAARIFPTAEAIMPSWFSMR
jgi:hypothetical protein